MNTLDDSRLPFILKYPEEYVVRNVTDRNMRPYIKFMRGNDVIFNITWGNALRQVVPPGWKRMEQIIINTPREGVECIIAKPRTILSLFLSRRTGYLTGAFLFDRVEYVFTFREEDLSDFKNMLKDRIQFRPISREPVRGEIAQLIVKVNELINNAKLARDKSQIYQVMREVQYPIKEFGKAGGSEAATCVGEALKVTLMTYVDTGIVGALDASNTALGALIDIGEDAIPCIQAGTMDSRRGVRNWFKKALKLSRAKLGRQG